MYNHKILHIINHFYPILGYQETYLAQHHSKKYNTLLITSNKYLKNIYKPNKNILKDNNLKPGFYLEREIATLRMPSIEIVIFNEPWIIGLEKAIIDFKPSIIIVHGLASINSFRIARLKGKLQSTKIIFDDHMTYNATRAWMILLYKILKYSFMPLILKAGDSFIATSPETKDFMQKIYGLPSKKIVIIPLGYDNNIFKPDINLRNIIRKKYELNDKDTVFIYVGKVVPEKGVHLIIESMIKLLEQNKDIKLLLIGGKDENYYSYINKKIVNYKLNKNIIFINPVPNLELAKFYNAADVGVWPLQCSVAMVEASACGLPIIISDKCGAIERVSYGNGFLYKESDINDLKKKMEELTNNRLREKMKKMSLKYVKELDWKILAEQFLNTVK